MTTASAHCQGTGHLLLGDAPPAAKEAAREAEPLAPALLERGLWVSPPARHNSLQQNFEKEENLGRLCEGDRRTARTPVPACASSVDSPGTSPEIVLIETSVAQDKINEHSVPLLA